MPAPISLEIFIKRFNVSATSKITIKSFKNFDYRNSKLECICNVCNTEYCTWPSVILNTINHGCHSCLHAMRIKQTSNMTNLSSNPKSRSKAVETLKVSGNAHIDGKLKSMITKQVKYNNPNYNNVDKIKSTKLKRYGSPTFNNTEKAQRTYFKTYGVYRPAQRTEIMDKIVGVSIKSKQFKMPSGKIVYLQGYEPVVVQQLLNNGYEEEDLLLKHRPSIKYYWRSDDGYGDNKWHIYHPDIVIISEHKIIEVKSNYTYNGNGDRLDWLSQNLAKQKGSIDSGYLHDFIIWHPRRESNPLVPALEERSLSVRARRQIFILLS